MVGSVNLLFFGEEMNKLDFFWNIFEVVFIYFFEEFLELMRLLFKMM